MNARSATAPSRPRRGHGEGSLFRRKSDGLWVATVSVSDGTRRRACAKTRAAAKAKLVEMLRAQGDGLDPAPSLTVAVFLRQWLASVEARVRPTTLRSYTQTVNGRMEPNGLGLIPALGHRRLAQLSVGDVEHYLGRLVAAGARGHTPARHRAVLSVGLADAMRWGFVGRNVASLARLPSTVPARVPKALTIEQARAFVEGTRHDRLHALWVLALFTGMREGELLGLAWDDIDFEARRLTVRSQLQRRDGGWVLTPPKTRAGARTVALAPDVVSALRDHQRRMVGERRPEWPFFGLVFVTPEGLPLYGWRVLAMLYSHEERLGLPRLPVHDLRHSAASAMLAAGVSLEDVSKTLGHSGVAITSRTYSHQMESQRQHVGEAMQRALGAG